MAPANGGDNGNDNDGDNNDGSDRGGCDDKDNDDDKDNAPANRRTIAQAGDRRRKCRCHLPATGEHMHNPATPEQM